MDSDTVLRVVRKVIDTCNSHYREHFTEVPPDRAELIATEALLEILKEEIEQRKKDTN